MTKEVAMKPILLATDGSPSALEATSRAVELADDLGAPLLAVAVEHVSVPSYGYYGYGEIYADLTQAEHEGALRVLAEVAAKAEDVSIPCETIATTGPVADEICRIARERDARFIVMGAHGWGAVRRLVFGSVSQAVLHDAPCPVLVVRSTAEHVETHLVDELATPV
jgi:nucleotide-binding universal stress UspA family protein